MLEKINWNFKQKGFTLLETLIAVAIMATALASILMIEISSIRSTEKTRKMTFVSLLAQNIMTQTELKLQNKRFKEVKKERHGTFEKPFKQFHWKRIIHELKFPELPFGEKGNVDRTTEIFARLLAKHLSKSIREVTITIFWKEGKRNYQKSLTSYWVDFSQEFAWKE